MAVKNVVTYGNSILRQRVKSVKDFNQLPELVEDMFDTMYENEGIGLAANQIGVDLNVMVVDISNTDESRSPRYNRGHSGGEEPRVFVNGRITDSWGESLMEEGCLSLPEIRFEIQRKEFIRFEYQDLQGQKYEEEFDGLIARVIQHEVDHLNGILIIDRISTLKKQQYKKKLEGIANLSREYQSHKTYSGIVL